MIGQRTQSYWILYSFNQKPRLFLVKHSDVPRLNSQSLSEAPTTNK